MKSNDDVTSRNETTIEARPLPNEAARPTNEAAHDAPSPDAPSPDALGHDAPEPDSSRERRRVSLLVTMIAFALYLSGVSSTVTYGGDCGELIAASYRLGIPHPTGYPLYCLLGRTFASLLPLGEIAWRYNVLSAVFAAFAAGLVTATVHRLTVGAPHEYSCDSSTISETTPAKQIPAHEYSSGTNNVTNTNETGGEVARRGAWISIDAWPSLGAGLLLAGFYYFWTQAVIAEVYSLNALMLCALLYGAVAWHQNGDWRWMYSLAALFGLALNAHLSCVFMAPGLFLYVVVQHRERFGFESAPSFSRRSRLSRLLPAPDKRLTAWRRIVTVFGFFLAAYALTLYLPVRSRLFPASPAANDWWPLDWTHPTNYARWYAHVSARQYKGLLFSTYPVVIGGHTWHLRGFASPLADVPAKLGTLLGSIALLYLWCAPLILTGIVRSFRGVTRTDEYSCGHRKRTGGRWLGALLGLTVLLNVGIEINYKVGDQANFFFPTYLAIALWLGLGLAGLWRAVQRRAARWEDRLASSAEASSATLLSALPPRRLATASLPILLVFSIASQWALAGPHVSRQGVTAARDAALERAQAMEKLEIAAAPQSQTPTAILIGDDSLWSFWYAKYVLGRAPRTRTPWGLARNEIVKQNRLAQFVGQLQRSGPVAMSAWDESVDRRFPYVLLTPSGNLCLASHRILPPPALPTNGSPAWRRSDDPQKLRDDGGLLASARFLWRSATPITPISDVLAPVNATQLKRENMYAFTLDFRVPWTTPLSPQIARAATIDNTSSPRAMHIGWIEVLLSPATPGREGHFATPPSPSQGSIRKQVEGTPPVVVWKQTRRLIVPQGVRAGTLLRAVVPLQMHTDAPAARYNVWLRLTRTPHDTRTPWRKLNDIEMTLD